MNPTDEKPSPRDVLCRLQVTVTPTCPQCRCRFKQVIRVTKQDSAVFLRCKSCGSGWTFEVPPYDALTHGKLVLQATPTKEGPCETASSCVSHYRRPGASPRKAFLATA